MFRSSGQGHVGGSLSIVEVIVALYFHVMNIDPKTPRWEERDRMILSKGHAAATWYAVLAERGFFPKSMLFSEFIKINGRLQGHPEMRQIPGVDMTSGALGQGLSVALGMSLAARLANKRYKIYVVLSDGEMQSGQVWEALMACSHFRANNITAIIDYNKLQTIGSVNDIMNLEPLAKKLEAFGWQVSEMNGNDMVQVVPALLEAKGNTSSLPAAIISHTIKGKGIPFMENRVEWHAGLFSAEHYRQAVQELNRTPFSTG